MFGFKCRKLTSLNTECSSFSLEHNADLFIFIFEKTADKPLWFKHNVSNVQWGKTNSEIFHLKGTGKNQEYKALQFSASIWYRIEVPPTASEICKHPAPFTTVWKSKGGHYSSLWRVENQVQSDSSPGPFLLSEEGIWGTVLRRPKSSSDHLDQPRENVGNIYWILLFPMLFCLTKGSRNGRLWLRERLDSGTSIPQTCRG